MSTYITALCAGPYHEVRDSHDGIDLGVFCRASMAQYLDADDLFLITKQGFDFFHEQFGVRYPLPKYDQLWVPDFNAGAMENFGCVTHAESHYIFRSQVTDFEYEQRANTILHELAHMWFGDLVTMRWWNDLWLNESFAEWASHWCNTHATRFTDAWTTFLSIRKNWGYRQDQLSSTHPVYCEMPDLEAVEVNFDGITYAKGASVLKQLVAYVGEEPFLAGLRAYFGKHAWGNATFDDLLTELEAASGRELRKFAAQWLETAQVNTLRPEVTIGADGTYERVVVRQEAPAGYPTLRTHRIGVGPVRPDRRPAGPARAARGGRDRRARPSSPALRGVPAADVLLLNDDDLTYAKLRLDERSMATVVQHIAGFESSLARALCWTAAWDMVRDAELAARDYVALVLAGLPAETDINLVTATLRQASTALTMYADPAWAPTGWAELARTARDALAAAEPGSGFQLAWARAFASAARSDEDLATLRGWLDGTGVPAGLTVDTELRWSVLQALVANGGRPAPPRSRPSWPATAPRAASGRPPYAHALVPTAENKAAVWAAAHRARRAAELAAPGAAAGLPAPGAGGADRAVPGARTSRWWRRCGPAGTASRRRSSSQLAYPAYQVERRHGRRPPTRGWPATGTRRRCAGWSAEGRDGVVRALAARAKDAAASRLTSTERRTAPSPPAPVHAGAGRSCGVRMRACERAQPLPAWLASWSRPLMMPPARSPPPNAPTMESAASLAYVSGMRLRAYRPVTISSCRWLGDTAISTDLSGSASWRCSRWACSRIGSSRPPTKTEKTRPVPWSARRSASSMRSSWRVEKGPSSTSGGCSSDPACFSPTVTCASGSTGRRLDAGLLKLVAGQRGRLRAAPSARCRPSRPAAPGGPGTRPE